MKGKHTSRKKQQAAATRPPRPSSIPTSSSVTPPQPPPGKAEPPPKADDTPTGERDFAFNARDLVAMAMWSRAQAARVFGQTAYHGLRDYNEVLGYKSTLEFSDYLSAYKRGGIARRIISLPAQDTWKKPPTISEGGKRDTPFVKAWDELVARVRVWSWLTRADRLSGIGRYGVLLMGFSGTDTFDKEVKGTSNQLVYLRAYSEGSASIIKSDDKATSPRYGMPTMYGIKFESDKPEQKVHWSRIIHLADGKDDSEVFGTPRLEAAANLVLGDLIKGVGGGAEALWLNMRKSPVFTNQPDFDFGDSDTAIAEQREQIEEFAHGLARYVFGEGLDVKEIGGQVTDPTGVVNVIIDQIAASTGIPRRVLLGSAAGELSAAQEDTRQWYGLISARQVEYGEDEILRPLINRLVQVGALPEPGSDGYNVGTLDENGAWVWPSLFQLTDLEQSEISRNQAQAISALRDPLTGQVPVTEQEQRQILGLTPVPRAVAAQRQVEALMVQNSQARYESDIRGAVRALRGERIDEFDFAGAMGPTVRIGLRRAWVEGFRAAGFFEDELTEEDEAQINLLAQAQIDHIDPFADFIIENRDKPLSFFNHRIGMWANHYLAVKSKAMARARNDPKLKFNLGPAEKHCKTCLRLNGKVKRASTWDAAGIGPQTMCLECVQNAGGILEVCKCFFTQTDERLSPGPLPRCA